MKEEWSSRHLLWFFLLTLTLEFAPSVILCYDDDYWAQRSQMLEEESNMSLGGGLELDDYEKQANVVLMTAKEAEVSEGFQNLSTYLPSLNFLTVAEKIQRSATFQIIQRLPKGAVLHAHDISIASAEYLYENITFRENLHVCLPEDGSISFLFLLSADSDDTCTSSKGWELLADLRANETIADDLNNLIWNSLTLVVPDPVTTYPNVDAVWVVANEIFGRVGQLLSYLPVYEDYYYQGLTELYEDNVLWLELRSTLPTLYDLNGTTYGPLEVAQLYKDTTDRFVNDYPDFIGAKLIYSPVRTATVEEMDEYLKIAEDLKAELPDFVAGFDLVGQEERGNPLIDYVDQLRNISADLHLFLHAGETQWFGLTTDENLIDAILLNTTRIGHGYAILKHPRVLELAVENDIAIEVNPIANQVGTLVHDMRNHPASFLFARDLPVVVSCDDPGLWGAVGLSYDWYEAFVGIMSRHADIRALKQLAINSIKYSAMSCDEKNLAYATWEDKWATFIASLV